MRRVFSGWIVLAAACAMLSPHSARANVQVSGLTDMALPAWKIGDGAVSGHMDMCIGHISLPSTDGYGVTVSSAGGFVLTNGARQIPYTLYWEDSGAGNLGSSVGTQLSNNVKLSGQHNANILSALCVLGTVGANARLTIKITQADMTAALAGTYSGTITILISPT